MSTELSEFVDMDPLHLTEQGLTEIIKHMRESLAQHEQGVKAVPIAPRKKSPKTAEILKDLGLE